MATRKHPKCADWKCIGRWYERLPAALGAQLLPASGRDSAPSLILWVPSSVCRSHSLSSMALAASHTRRSDRIFACHSG